MKKISIIFIFVLLLISFVYPLNAKSILDGLTSIKEIKDSTSRDINGVANLKQATYTTYNAGVKTKIDNHPVSFIEPNESILENDLRIVAYSVGTNKMWAGKRPSDIARQFEIDHPEWLVLGGTNGDFFEIDDNHEPCGTFMQEGDFLKSYAGFGEGAMGFRNDGTYIYGFAASEDKEAVFVLKDGEYQRLVSVDSVDTSTPGNISLYTRYANVSDKNKDAVYNGDLNPDFSSYFVYVINYEMQRYDRETDRVFVKGKISNILENTKTLTINDKDASVYLVSKNKLELNIGDYIKVTPVASGDWANVDNIVGAYGHILENGNVIDHADSPNDYVNAIKNRTVIGFKEDGTPVLMCIEMASYGASYLECGEILKSVGCVNGCLLDGGGSSCLFIRNENNEFELINKQTDGSERRDGNAVLLVQRRPGFDIEVSNVKRSSFDVQLKVTNQALYDTLSNIKVTISNDKESITKDYNGILNFSNLLDNAEYKIEVNYNIPSFKKDKIISSSLSKNQKTLEFILPTDNGLKVKEIGKSSVKIVRDLNVDRANEISNVVVYVGDFSYNMGDKEEIICDNLFSDLEYDVYFTYDVTDPETNRTYHVSTLDLDGGIKIKTLSYDKPEFVDFSIKTENEDNLVISYQYNDTSKVVKNASVYVNGEKLNDLNLKKGTIKIDFKDQKELTIIIKLSCAYDGDEFEIVSDNIEYKIEKEKEDNPTPIDQNPSDNPDQPSDPVEIVPTPKKKCGKKSSELIISLISLSTLLAFVIKKRN